MSIRLASPFPGPLFLNPGSEGQPPRQIDRITVVVAVYLAIAALLLIRLAVSLRALTRLRSRCVAVEHALWVEIFDRWRSQLGVTRRVPLLFDGGCHSPGAQTAVIQVGHRLGGHITAGYRPEPP